MCARLHIIVIHVLYFLFSLFQYFVVLFECVTRCHGLFYLQVVRYHSLVVLFCSVLFSLSLFVCYTLLLDELPHDVVVLVCEVLVLFKFLFGSLFCL